MAADTEHGGSLTLLMRVAGVVTSLAVLALIGHASDATAVTLPQ